jgi:branched-chain amino acid transport system permease protein
MLLEQLLINGIAIGAIYALLAAGFSIIYNTTRMLHLAHGTVYTFGAYAYYVLAVQVGMGLWLSIPFVIAITALFGLAIEVGIYRPVRFVGGGTSAILIASLGIISLFEGIFSLVFTTDTRTLREGPLPSIVVGGNAVTILHIAILIVVVIVFPLLQLFLKRSRLGTAIRALAENPQLAEAQGMETKRLYVFILGLGSALAAIAGMLVSLDLGVRPDMGFDAVFTAIVAGVIGGIGYFPGALLGAFLLAILQQLVVWHFNSAWQSGMVFFILIVFLIVRPQGIFGGRLVSRRA